MTRGRIGEPGDEAGREVEAPKPIRHWIMSQKPVLPLVENEEDWNYLRDGVMEHWQPEGVVEEELALRMADIFWRMRRASRFETNVVAASLMDVPRDWALSRSMRGLGVVSEVTPEAMAEMDRMLALRLLPGDEPLAKVMRYETNLYRFLGETTQMMLDLKTLRDPRGGWRTIPNSRRNAKKRRNTVVVEWRKQEGEDGRGRGRGTRRDK
jgi:hypothetical protein